MPSVDEVLKADAADEAVLRFGRQAVVAVIRLELDARRAVQGGAVDRAATVCSVAEAALGRLEAEARPKVRPVFNLTGTVLHTNLGRAALAEAAIEAATVAMRNAIALEFDTARGSRGERDDLVRDLLCELTGAESATLVNNNAAALMLVLNTLSKGKDAIVSRGELIEIGGAFRLPEIMARAGAKLVEVGTTNRTHARDYTEAIGPKTGLVLKVHTSNYRIEGFTSEVGTGELAGIARARGVPLVHDLGSGTIIDLARYGLPHEPTVREVVAAGPQLVTFSGDKLLGGPQAGFIVGTRDEILRLNKNPMKRALRVDKIRLAAIEATLRLYRDPDRIAERLPTVRLLARPSSDIREQATRLIGPVSDRLGEGYVAEVALCSSQIGSGALPQATVPSAGISIRPAKKRGGGGALAALAAALRNLPTPVLGRISQSTLLLDLRCLEDEAGLLHNLRQLDTPRPDAASPDAAPRLPPASESGR